MKSRLTAMFFIFISCFAYAGSNQSIPYTLEDRERLIRLEEGFKALSDKLDARFAAQDSKFDAKFDAQDAKFEAKFDAIQKQLDFTNNLILTLIASLIGTIVYMWWDRRAANAPVKEAIEEERKKSQQLIKALREYSESHPELKSIFDRAAIL